MGHKLDPKIWHARDRTGQDRTGQDKTGQGRAGQGQGQDITGQGRAGQDRTGKDKTGQDRTGQSVISESGRKRHFPKSGQQVTKRYFPIKAKTIISKIGTTSDPKNPQTLRPNVVTPLQVYDTKGWYCANATSIVIASKQRK